MAAFIYLFISFPLKINEMRDRMCTSDGAFYELQIVMAKKYFTIKRQIPNSNVIFFYFSNYSTYGQTKYLKFTYIYIFISFFLSNILFSVKYYFNISDP